MFAGKSPFLQIVGTGLAVLFFPANSPAAVAQDDIPPASMIPAEFALLDVAGREPSPLSEETRPEYLEGAFIYVPVKETTPAADKAVLQFSVTRSGPVYLMASWAYDGSTAGGWTKERVLHGDLYDKGWLELGRCPWDTTHILYQRNCQAGETFRLRTRKFNPPILLIGRPVNFLDARYQDTLPVRSLKRLYNRRHLELLAAGKFAELDRIADALRRDKKRFRNGDCEIDNLYAALSQPGTEVETEIGDEQFQMRIRRLEAWAEASPKSLTPRLALAKAYLVYAAHARGSGWGFEVTEENSRLYEQRSTKARDMLLEMEKNFSSVDPALYAELISVGRNLGGPREMIDAYLAKSVKLDPAYAPSFEEVALYLMPRWHGESGDLEEFADRTIEMTKESCGSLMYAVIVEKMSWYLLVDTFETFEFSWEKTRQGYRDRERLYPRSREHLDRFCYLACTVGDRETAQRLFERIGDDYRISQWGVQSRFEEWKAAFQPGLDKGDHQKYQMAHRDGVLDLAIAPNNRYIATTGLDRRVRIWDAVTQKQLLLLRPDESYATCVAFSPVAPWLAAGLGSGKVLIWDLSSGQSVELERHQGRLRGICFSPDGSHLATAGADGRIVLWNAQTTDVVHEVSAAHAGDVRAIAFSPEGKSLASVGKDGRVILTDSKTGKTAAEWKANEGTTTAVAFAPDGKRLATGDGGGTIRIWDVPGKAQVATSRPAEFEIRKLDFSPDGNHLAIACGAGRLFESGAAFLWSALEGEAPRPLSGHKMSVTSIRFAPNGKMVATCSMDWSLRQWEVRAAKQN